MNKKEEIALYPIFKAFVLLYLSKSPLLICTRLQTSKREWMDGRCRKAKGYFAGGMVKKAKGYMGGGLVKKAKGYSKGGPVGGKRKRKNK